MRKVTEISPTQDHCPIELRHLRVAAYCRVSTQLEEQTSSIELQEHLETYYMKLLYIWIEEFRRIEHQSIVVDDEYVIPYVNQKP